MLRSSLDTGKLTYALVWPGVVVLFPILPENASKVVFFQNQDMV